MPMASPVVQQKRMYRLRPATVHLMSWRRANLGGKKGKRGQERKLVQVALREKRRELKEMERALYFLKDCKPGHEEARKSGGQKKSRARKEGRAHHLTEGWRVKADADMRTVLKLSRNWGGGRKERTH